MLKYTLLGALGLIILLGCSGPALAENIVSVNFVGNAGVSGTLASDNYAGLAGGEVANTLGNTFVNNWNNMGGTTGSSSSLMDNTSSVVGGLSISWNCYNLHAIPDVTGGTNNGGTGGANPTMMKGYLDNATEGAITVLASGIPYAEYAVVVYIDGDNEEYWRRGSLQIDDGTAYSTEWEDSESVNFNSGLGNNANGLFQGPVSGGVGNQNWPFTPNNSEGNVVIFAGLTGSSFTLTNSGTDTDSPQGLRSPINGIQIVGEPVPEPATMMIVAAGIPILLKRRHGRR